MPNIPQFNAPALDLRPTETGIDALQQSARRIGAFYGQAANDQAQSGQRLGSAIKDAGDVVAKYAEHQEVVPGIKNFATMFANKTQEWNDIASKTPPDQMAIAAQKFRDSIEPDLQKFQDSFFTEGGQKFAESHIASLRQHLAEKTMADSYHAAGEATKVNAAQSTNQLASAARLDPSSLDFALQTVESNFEHLITTSGVTGDIAARLRTEELQKAKVGIIKSAAMGLIEKNPNADLTEFQKKYDQYVSGAEMGQLIKAQTAELRRERLDKHQEAVTQKQVADLKVHTDTNKLFTDNVTFDTTTNRPIVKPGFAKGMLDIVKANPDAPSAASTAKSYIDWYEHQQNVKDEAPRTNPAVMADLMGRMVDPENPTTVLDVLNADAKHQLSPHDLRATHALASEMEKSPIRGPQYQNAIDAVKERVGYGILADGHERFNNAMAVFYPAYMKALKSGELKANALNLRDEHSLIRETIHEFEPDAQTKMLGHSLKNLGLSNLDALKKLNLPGGENFTGPNTAVTGVKVENQPVVRTQAEYDKLAPGSSYVAPDGKVRTKGAK